MLGWELPPHNSGGLGVVCYQLCRVLAQKGADIEFVLPYQADYNIDFMRVTAAHPQGVSEVIRAGSAYDSYKYIYDDGHSEWLTIYDQQRVYEHAVARLVPTFRRQFDVIHAHDWLTFRAGLRAKQQLGLPLILHVHTIERDRAGGTPGNPLVRDIESLAFAMADHIIAVSQRTKEMIAEDYGVPLDKIEVVYNHIDQAALAPPGTDSSYPYLMRLREQGYHIVTNVGRLTVQKNLPALLHAARDVIARVPKTIFLFVGGGEQYFELLQLAADLGIARNVLFAGFQRGKRWRDAYGIADLFAMTSVSEPFGLTVLEAIAYDAPVLMSRQSGVAEVIKNGLTVDYWDVRELANKIVAVVQNPALRQELHQNARRELDRLSWDESAAKLLDAFDRHATRHGQLAEAAA